MTAKSTDRRCDAPSQPQSATPRARRRGLKARNLGASSITCASAGSGLARISSSMGTGNSLHLLIVLVQTRPGLKGNGKTAAKGLTGDRPTGVTIRLNSCDDLVRDEALGWTDGRGNGALHASARAMLCEGERPKPRVLYSRKGHRFKRAPRSSDMIERTSDPGCCDGELCCKAQVRAMSTSCGCARG